MALPTTMPPQRSLKARLVLVARDAESDADGYVTAGANLVETREHCWSELERDAGDSRWETS